LYKYVELIERMVLEKTACKPDESTIVNGHYSSEIKCEKHRFCAGVKEAQDSDEEE
jgi:hypothetical protein